MAAERTRRSSAQRTCADGRTAGRAENRIERSEIEDALDVGRRVEPELLGIVRIRLDIGGERIEQEVEMCPCKRQDVGLQQLAAGAVLPAAGAADSLALIQSTDFTRPLRRSLTMSGWFWSRFLVTTSTVVGNCPFGQSDASSTASVPLPWRMNSDS